MSSASKSRILRLGLGLVVIVTLLVFGLLHWLTSGIGRGVIETRLSSAMGRPVRLEGDFSMALLPLPGAAGSDLQIFSRDGRFLFLAAGQYMARLELWPLLRGEAEVVALHVEDAAMDFGVLSSEEPLPEQPGKPSSGLPSIQNFELGNTRVFMDGMDSEPYLQIGNFELEDFSLGAYADFFSDAALISDGETLFAVEVAGQLMLTADSVLDVQLSSLDISYEDWLIKAIEGEVSASLEASDLHLHLQWMDAAQQFSLSTRLNLEPGYPDIQPGFEIKSLEISLDEHVIRGDGCLLLLEPPALHLDMKAPSMELGDLTLLVEKWAAPGAEFTDSAEGTDELPIALAVILVIDQASYDDALAEGVRITAGSVPNCPGGL